MSNILEQANKIINERSEEKERQYGPMGEGFERAAMIASGMSGREWNAHDMFIAMVALKFSRQSYNFKEDNLLDAVAYIGAWQNYINETKPSHAGPDSKEQVSSVKTPVEEEEDTLDGPIAESPYLTTHPRDVLNALIQLGGKNENS
tara:strand:- start:2290 stop:2730 length:441 start_codon:yes stop_codon:yes gene_type:complete